MKQFIKSLLVICFVAVTTVTAFACEDDKHKHDYQTKVISPTCMADGYTLHFCSCGNSYESDPVPATGHKHTPERYSDSENHWYSCSVCYEEVDVQSHDWDEGVVTVSPTYTETGVKMFVCKDCGKEKRETVDVVEHAHNFGDEWASDAESHWKTCLLCMGQDEKVEHSWSEGVVTVSPTYTETGIKKFVCLDCGREKNEELPVVNHTHSYASNWTSNEKYHWYTCTQCDGEKDKAEHTWENETITLPATTTQKGLKQYSCSVCSAVKTEEIPKLPAPNQPKYALSSDKASYRVIGFDGALSDITIPSTYNGLRVIEIADEAFKGNTSVKKITLPNTIRYIGNSAFENCGNLTQINIPESVVSIGVSAFNGCTSLSSVSFAEEIKGRWTTTLSIKESAFENCVNLQKVTLAENTKELGASVFKNCYSLKTIVFNDLLETIGNGAFAGCHTLTGVTFKDGLATIGAFAFDGCSAIEKIVIPSNVGSLGEGAFRFAESLKEVTLSENITSIGNVTFQNCTALKKIVLHENITSIGASAFSCCTALTEVRILGNIQALGGQAFYRCENLTSIYYNSSTKISFSNEQYIFYDAGKNGNGITLTVGKDGYIPSGIFQPLHNENAPKITSIVIEEGAEKINYLTSATHNYMPYVKTVKISSTVTEIAKSAFSGCSALTSYVVASGNKYFKAVNGDLYSKYGTEFIRYAIGKNSESFTLQTGVISVAEGAFYGCEKLAAITIPDTLVQFTEGMFDGCDNLTAINAMSGSLLYKTENGVLYKKDGTVLVRYPHAKSVTSFTIPYTVLAVADYAFYGCNNLSSVRMQSALLTIGEKAFAYCEKLNLITMGSFVQTIGEYAFIGCTSLSTISFSSSVNTIGFGAFYGCDALTEMTLPFIGNRKEGVVDTHLGYIFGAAGYEYNVSYVPENLRKVTLTGDTVPSYAFYGCISLEEVNALSATTVQSYAFYNCKKLETLATSNTIFAIDKYAFYNCQSLPTLSFGYNLISIGDSAFYGCKKWTSVVIPTSVEQIGYNAFGACPLVEITLPFVGKSISSSTYLGYIFGASSYSYNGENVPQTLKKVTVAPNAGLTISTSAFYGCYGIENIVLKDSVVCVNSGAFYGCYGLKEMTLPFVGESLNETSYYGLFGYIFGTNSYSYATGVSQYYSSSSYKTYYIPSGLEKVTLTGGSLSYGAFYNCDMLLTVVLGESVTSIGSYAFYDCGHLREIDTKNVTSIGNYAFKNCNMLTGVTFGNNLTEVGRGVLDGTGYYNTTGNWDNGVLYADKWLVATKTSTDYLTSKYTVKSGTKGIADYAFYQQSNMTGITLHDDVTSIGSYAFYDCDGLQEITIPSKVTSIDSYAFYDCDGLVEATIGKSVNYIGSYAFYGCDSLERVDFKTTSGWYRTSSSSYTSGTTISNLSNEETAASYLTYNYYGYYWKRNG